MKRCWKSTLRLNFTIPGLFLLPQGHFLLSSGFISTFPGPFFFYCPGKFDHPRPIFTVPDQFLVFPGQFSPPQAHFHCQSLPSSGLISTDPGPFFTAPGAILPSEAKYLPSPGLFPLPPGNFYHPCAYFYCSWANFNCPRTLGGHSFQVLQHFLSCTGKRKKESKKNL